MRTISTNELSLMLGGTWTECDLVIILGNTIDDSWTDKMIEDWNNLFEKHCL
jgi:hypothetical protein